VPKTQNRGGVDFFNQVMLFQKDDGPETKLWKNVLIQSVIDTVWGDYRSLQTYGEKKDAKEWCNLNNPDFIEVCELAGFNPNYLYKRIKILLERKKNVGDNNMRSV
tara:strand:- start:891 stop:1208 length:318 start_codon:yes stop_codon:yes gene_type:complete